MDGTDINNLASQIRSSPYNKSNIFTISTKLIAELTKSFDILEEQATSFQLTQGNNPKIDLLRDLQYLHNFIQQCQTLKLYAYPEEGSPIVDITKFKNLLFIEFNKIDVNTVKGLQSLRSQLQKITCQKCPNTIGDILSNCGGDQSQNYCWSELKEAIFINCNISEINSETLECIPWLHTLDLSHNELTNIEPLTCLANLKYLNLSFNKLENVPLFKGQICSRLQHLILKNNFIEDLSGLKSLTNIWVLDLSNNCLVDYKTLLVLSHLATLQWLNLQNNPLSFHPNHRNKIASYLHINVASTQFVLNHEALTKIEKKIVGSFHPRQSKNHNVALDSVNLSIEKVRRVRKVTIEEVEVDENNLKKNNIQVLPSTPRQYLETKKQIENLHETYGESWLNAQSGLLVQNVLGLEGTSLPLSSSPYETDFTFYSGEFTPSTLVEKSITKSPEPDIEEYEEKCEEIEDLDGEEGEGSIFLATVESESEPIIIIVGETHICEKEYSTGNEIMRWHVKSIQNCKILNENEKFTSVQIDFETMRKNRKQRIYLFEAEIDNFIKCINNKINLQLPKNQDENNIKYQCMKCSKIFIKIKNETAILVGNETVKCPNCDSNLVVEHV